MPLEIVAACAFVAFVAWLHFDTIPSTLAEPASGLPKPLGLLLALFRRPEAPSIFPPPRANTTILRFWFYRTVYCGVAVGLFVGATEIPGVRQGIDTVIAALASDILPAALSVSDLSPIALAIVLSLLVCYLPPFSSAENALRGVLYEHAHIPAELDSLMQRLRIAGFTPNAETEERVRNDLAADGFDPALLHYDTEAPTLESRWMKAAVLMDEIGQWRARRKFRTAFAAPTEVDRKVRSFDKLTHTFNALREGDAHLCLAVKRPEMTDDERVQLEARFRRDVKVLLWSIYAMLGRISLLAHIEECERVRDLNAMGFALEPRRSPPVPQLADLVALAALLIIVWMVPMSTRLGVERAATIGLIIYLTVLSPALLAYFVPKFGRICDGRPFVRLVAFALSAGALAVVASLAVNTAVSGSSDPLGEVEIIWTTRGHWLLVCFAMAALLAWRFGSSGYPDPVGLKGWQRYRCWADLTDGVIVGGVVLAILAFHALPAQAELSRDPSIAADPLRLAVGGTLCFLVGFFVPTWYRGRRAKKAEGDQPRVAAPLDGGSSLSTA